MPGDLLRKPLPPPQAGQRPSRAPLQCTPDPPVRLPANGGSRDSANRIEIAYPFHKYFNRAYSWTVPHRCRVVEGRGSAGCFNFRETVELLIVGHKSVVVS